MRKTSLAVGLFLFFNRTAMAIEPTSGELKITGTCEVLVSEGSLIDGGPCQSLPLNLESISNKEIVNTRTSIQGDFEFHVMKLDKYKLGVTSRFYEVVSPTKPISAGSTIHVKLKQK